MNVQFRIGVLCWTALLLGACTQPPPVNLPPSTVVVDTGLKPTVTELAGINGGAARPVTTVTDQNGSKVDFVQNELIVITDKRADLDALLARWQGQILDTVDPSALGLAEAKPLYLIRVNVSAADTGKMAADFKQLAPEVRSDLKVGSDDGLKLLAVQAREAVGGAILTPNWVMQPSNLETGPVNEAMNGDNDAGAGMTYSPNAVTWSYMRVGGPQDTGVTKAWQALSLAGRFANKVPIAILDGGFQQNADLPNTLNLGGWDKTNPAKCSGGSTCDWHGTGTSLTAFGEADNGFGVAGVAGPVARRILVQGSYSTWEALAKVIALSLDSATRPRVVNMSFGGNLPAVSAATSSPALNVMTLAIRVSGTLIVAAAGNDNLDLSEEDCFLGVCWAKRSAYPCELGNVLCVGAMNRGNRQRASFSNYKGSIDIYGPGTVWAPEDNINSGNMRLVNGTSVASPFVAGVAALVWAANPGLGPNDVEKILLETAHTDNGDGNVGRAVNAAAAVLRALGNVPPNIQSITNPARVDVRVETNLASFFKVTHPVAGSVNLTVTSNLDGVLYNGPWVIKPSGLAGPPELKRTFAAQGQRILTLLANYNGEQTQASLTVDAVNTAPTLSLNSGGTVNQGVAYPITALIGDINEPDPSALCANTTWAVDAPDTLSSNTGCSVSVTFGTTGARQVRVSTRDREGLSTPFTQTLAVQPPPVNPYPTIAYSQMFYRGTTYPCGNGGVADGVTINLSSIACIGADRSPLTRYFAEIAVSNPSKETLTYDWKLYVGSGAGETVHIGNPTSRLPTFDLYTPFNAGETTSACRVTVKVNAPEASRSKGPVTVWSGRCFHYTFRVN